MPALVLSLFPGIGLLDRAFEEEGFCVVRGPDVLWGGDVRRFRPPAQTFAGVIGGPPCQEFSSLALLNKAQGRTMTFANLIPEYERVVGEAGPAWFVMENVTAAPLPSVDGYEVHAQLLNNRWLGEEQNRVRRFSFGTRDGRKLRIETVALEPARYATALISGGGAPPHSGVRGVGRKGRKRERLESPRTVTSGIGGRSTLRGNERLFVPGAVTSSDGGASKKMWRYSIAEACQLQGLPEDMVELYEKHAPFRADAKLKAIANGVPLPMGRAIARAVKLAMYPESIEVAS